MPIEAWAIVVILIAVVILALPRLLPAAGPACARCRGSGQINERRRSASQSRGWQVLAGTCPTCQGKGRLRR